MKTTDVLFGLLLLASAVCFYEALRPRLSVQNKTYRAKPVVKSAHFEKLDVKSDELKPAPSQSPDSRNLCHRNIAQRYQNVVYFCQHLSESSSKEEWQRCHTMAEGFVADFPGHSCFSTEDQSYVSANQVERERDEANYHL